MYLALIILITICCVLLVLVVLAQNPKGGGLSAEFGGGSSQMMGVKRTTDLLEKLTWGFAVGILVLSLAANMMLPRKTAGEETGITTTNIEKAKEVPNPQPAQPQAPAEGQESGGELTPDTEE